VLKLTNQSSNYIPKVLSHLLHAELKLTTLSWLSDTAHKEAKTTGSLRTHGVHHGVSLDIFTLLKAAAPAPPVFAVLLNMLQSQLLSQLDFIDTLSL